MISYVKASPPLNQKQPGGILSFLHKYGYLFLLIILVIVIGILHHVTPSNQLFWHELYRRLGYFPIVVGGLLYGLRGGLIIAFLSLFAFIPHLLHLYHFDLDIYRSDLTEIILYLSAGALVGSIAGKEKKLREKYKHLSIKLEK